MGSDAVAVIDPHKLTAGAAKAGMVEPLGFIPTQWMPMSIDFTGDKLYVATDKGRGTGPNNFPQKPAKGPPAAVRPGRTLGKMSNVSSFDICESK
jgi:hypothetical protein